MNLFEDDEVLKMWNSLPLRDTIPMGNELNINCLSVILNDEEVRNYIKEFVRKKGEENDNA